MDIEKAQEFKGKGNKAFQEKNYQEAIDNFTEAIKYNPHDHVFYSNRSACFASLEKYQEALTDATKCVELNPGWAKGYTRKGLAEYYMGSYDEAIATYNKGLELDPENVQLKEGLQRAEQGQMGGGPGGAGANPFASLFTPEKLAGLMTNPKVSKYFSEPDFMQKLQMIQQNPQLISSMMGDPRIMEVFSLLIGVPMTGEGAPGDDTTAAESTPTTTTTTTTATPTEEKKKEEPKVSSISPAEEYKAQGNAAYKKKEFEKAIELYDKAIEAEPKEIAYMTNKASVYIELKQYDKCIEICNEAIKLGRENHVDYIKIAKAYARIGSAYTKMEKYDEAVEAFDSSLLEHHDYKVKEQQKAVIKMKKKQEEEAYINPELALEHKDKGNGLFKEGLFPAAIKEYDESLKRNPKDPKVWSNRAAAYLKLMEAPTALKDIEKSIALDANFAKAWARKGNCHFLMKEYHKAIEAFDKGLALEPSNHECAEGKNKTMMMIQQANYSGENDEERFKHAMADPEIQALLTDPQITQVLKDFQENPTAAQKSLSDPKIAAAINKLIAAGVIKTR
mmetsp:Transcript_3737/g.4048  ORF Transcript_3737/g.4048 Transcript_3737/m.4048 type:complete len:563 (-) Transcript_3737:206-1894(-)|eukprot:CAMPEP_0114997130 /NCGR_PEP_ID=MMETSP0216-20121206/14724_1 /TAXON_ID=223996 /ORGANISM="Protocruzia adherens, Strain Boccale" /LENGTH=562 /DNA_ID=CAMNT_0002361469 /DNA_START=111 /DNA_END=1799 /DNA_ORIENTATION=+